MQVFVHLVYGLHTPYCSGIKAACVLCFITNFKKATKSGNLNTF